MDKRIVQVAKIGGELLVLGGLSYAWVKVANIARSHVEGEVTKLREG